uniref:Major facilitator superfamily (MFS) profile domain-containing protein n=1 Tax=Acrobeloides nanus TaxID=290746 RepID=A0A914DZT3_9BILA
MRFLQGFATSMCFTSMGSITSQWSTMKESGFFIAFLSTHFQFGNAFTMPIAGALCESRWGWPSLYYLQGTLTAIVSIAFYLFYRDDPYWHGFVSNNELSKIEEGKVKIASRDGNNTKNKKNAPKKVPYKAIFTDFVVWGTVMGITFIRFGFLLFVQFGPFYLNKVMKFDIKSTGIGSALPYVGSIVLKIIVGQLSDRITCIPMKLNLKLFVTIASLFLVLGNLSLVFLTAEYSFLAQIAFIIVISFTDNTQAQWKVIFIGISIIIFAGTIIFNIVADVEPRKWVKNSSIKNTNLPNNEISIISLPDDEKKSKNDV